MTVAIASVLFVWALTTTLLPQAGTGPDEPSRLHLNPPNT
jgi:hypothetical protein